MFEKGTTMAIHSNNKPTRCTWLKRQRGSATAVDFMLTFPIFAFLMLFFMQMALVLHAYTVVQHAAYSAARSARVQVLDVDHAFLALDFHPLQQLLVNAPVGLRLGDALLGTNLTGFQTSMEHIHASAMNQLVSVSPARAVFATNGMGANWHEESFNRYVTKITEGYDDERAGPLVRKARYAYDPANTLIELSLLPDLSLSLGALTDVEVIYNSLRDKWNQLRAGELPQDGFVDWPVYVTVSYRYQLQIPLGAYWFENDEQRRYARWMTAKVRLL